MNEQLSRSLETSESTNRSQRGQIRRSDYRKRSLTAMEEAAQRANNFVMKVWTYLGRSLFTDRSDAVTVFAYLGVLFR